MSGLTVQSDEFRFEIATYLLQQIQLVFKSGSNRRPSLSVGFNLVQHMLMHQQILVLVPVQVVQAGKTSQGLKIRYSKKFTRRDI